MQSIIEIDDAVNSSFSLLGCTIQDNGDATVDLFDETSGAVITETIRGYMWPVDDRQGGPAQGALRELPDALFTSLDGDDLPW
jgi:hypothetical protein